LLVTLLPLSLTNPEPVVFRTLPGAEHMKRWPRGHSYYTPTKIFTTNSDRSETWNIWCQRALSYCNLFITA
jgi:hypothetical protein